MNDSIAKSNVAFGTSGARGLVVDMTDLVCYSYTQAFLRYLQASNQWQQGQAVVIGGDLRPSTPRIMAACAKACVDFGSPVINAGDVPSPAVALHGFLHKLPSLMITGSHIPDDRNGIKFNTPTGEILKADEQGISSQSIAVPEGEFDSNGMLSTPFLLPEIDPTIRLNYIERYSTFFGGVLTGQTVGVYQHSAVGRDIVMDILRALGAHPIALGRSDTFIPVDTEAIRPEDVTLAKQWASEHQLDAIVSTDGDSDRPLVSDEHGEWLRGDVLGILCAQFLNCTDVVTPVSSNSALEKSNLFNSTVRTRIGSPYVIEGMKQLLSENKSTVAGYEANGGFLLASAVHQHGKILSKLPTRDAVIVMLCILAMAKAKETSVSQLLQQLPARFTVSDRIKNFPTQVSMTELKKLSPDDAEAQKKLLTGMFGHISGQVVAVNQTDGLRMSFANDEIIHLRPSGNAPELRCYTEATSPERAHEINQACMGVLSTWQA